MSTTTRSYFPSYPTFNHDPTAPLLSEFDRLSMQQGWPASSHEYHRQRRECLIREFELHYGDSGDGSLAGWQGLCGECGIGPVPGSITQCRKALKSINISIVNLLDCRRSGRGGTPRLFPSKKALCQHIKVHHEMFPLSAAKRNGFVCALLKVVDSPKMQQQQRGR